MIASRSRRHSAYEGDTRAAFEYALMPTVRRERTRIFRPNLVPCQCDENTLGGHCEGHIPGECCVVKN